MPLSLQKHRRLCEFSTFGIGGPIRFFAEVASEEDMEEAFAFVRGEGMPFWVLGKGSNCLFPDRGFDGLVLLNKIDVCQWRDAEVEVGAGYSFSLLGVQSARRGLSGLEFAAGIPASVGGAVFMNAGANGKETCESLAWVRYLDVSGNKREYLRSELAFGYRMSPFQGMCGAILGVRFRLEALKGARAKQLSIVECRMKTQPLKEKSAGCIFRNPENGAAGALIEQCGLKGLRVGGAKVSEVHANFIVNKGNATAQEVLELVRQVQKRVEQQTGIHLEPEVRVFS